MDGRYLAVTLLVIAIVVLAICAEHALVFIATLLLK